MTTTTDRDVFHAIAHPTRRALMDTLRAADSPVRDLATRFDSSRPAVSQHLRVLLDAGVSSRSPGTAARTSYHLQAAPLAEVRGWLGHYEQFWSDRLRTLATVLDELP